MSKYKISHNEFRDVWIILQKGEDYLQPATDFSIMKRTIIRSYMCAMAALWKCRKVRTYMAKNKGKVREDEDARKAKYGTFVCIRWVFSRMWQWDKSLFLSSVMLLPVVVALYALGLYTPSIILNSLQVSGDFRTIVQVIIILVGAGFFFRLIHDFFHELRWNAEHRAVNRFFWEVDKVDAKKDFFLNFDEEYRKIRNRAWQILGRGANGSPGRYIISFFDMAANVFCFLLFGSVVSALNPLILLLLVLGSLLTLIPRRYQQDRDFDERDERNANSQKLQYLSWNLSNTLHAGKDIRIYGFTEFLDDKMHTLIDDHTHLLRRQQKNRALPAYVNFAVGFTRDALAYLYLIRGAVEGSISPAEFVLYFNAISQLSGFVDQIIDYFGSVHEVVLGISDCIVFFDEPRDRMNHGEGIPLPQGRPLSVEFRHVTYKYPKGEKNVLEDISFRIDAGEKISLVGLNGAGKTTLTKLMCGLILPDAGEILIDGHLLQEYNRDELYTLFSIVPQDYTILPTTVAENIAFCERGQIDEKRLWSCLEMAEMADRVRSLPKGIDSGMDRQYDEDAVSFSGGELQRLLLARAIYHESSIMILDEPTAALDPIAEDHIYQKYREMTKNSTSVFISHRLASTRFCDRIYLLDGACILESGTHEELMGLSGKYRELFDVQSQYYKEGANPNEEGE